MKISIIIPMYNEERYITRCLESLQKQTYKDFEIILIDDGSTDTTIEKAGSFPVKILKQEHGGPGKARNWGATEAKGNILVFVDADMFFDKKYIENLIQPILNKQELGTAHGTELVGNLENPIARAYGTERGVFEDGERSGVFRAFLKEKFLEAGGYDSERYAFEDNFTQKIGTALFVKDAICYHNNPESLSEIFKHEIWIGESLLAKGTIKEYLYKYKYWLLSLVFIGSIIGIFLFFLGFIIYLPLVLIGVIMSLVGIKTIQRIIKEGYISHLLYIPMVMIVRGLGYITGIIKFTILKK